MNALIPLVFSVLTLSQTPSDQPFDVAVPTGDSVEMIVPVDTVGTSAPGVKLAFFDVLSTRGGSRRVMMSIDAQGQPVAVRDGGSFGAEGFVDELYFTDKRNETISAYIEVADAAPSLSPAPEGNGTIIEMTDRLTLTVLNFDQADRTVYTLRDNQVTYLVDPEGHIRLTSIRPRPNDLDDLVANYRIYLPGSEDPSSPITARQLVAYLSTMFPGL